MIIYNEKNIIKNICYISNLYAIAYIKKYINPNKYEIFEGGLTINHITIYEKGNVVPVMMLVELHDELDNIEDKALLVCKNLSELLYELMNEEELEDFIGKFIYTFGDNSVSDEFKNSNMYLKIRLKSRFNY